MRLFSKYCRIGVFLLMTSPFALAESDAVSPKEASAMQGENKAVIVDVREDDEWNEHHIHGGVRSAKAQTALKLAGFSKVYNLDGGIQAWDEQGMATE